MPPRPPQRLSLVFGVVLLAVAGCNGNAERVDELENQLSELQQDATTTTQPATTSTSQPATTTTSTASLTAAQKVYCDDLTSVIQEPTSTGGTTNRPETVQFFEIAHELGYLTLPFEHDDWPEPATTADEFVFNVYWSSPAQYPETDVGGFARAIWSVPVLQDGVDAEQAYAEVCLNAWELR